MFSVMDSRSLNSTLFNIAHAYSRAGDMAGTAIFNTGDADFAAPAIMSKSFAIELLLKFFIVIAHPGVQTKADLDSMGVNLRGHVYSELYDRISPIYQNKIVDSFTALVGQPTDGPGFRKTLIDIGDDPFVFWRYIYEKSGICHLDIDLLDKVLHALGKAAEIERKRITTNQTKP
jgi:hypothetical protein